MLFKQPQLTVPLNKAYCQKKRSRPFPKSFDFDWIGIAAKILGHHNQTYNKSRDDNNHNNLLNQHESK